MRLSLITAIFSSFLIFSACKPFLESAPLTNAERAELKKWKMAYRRPMNVTYPDANRFSEAKYHLGYLLFFDPRLSKNVTLSCASCHDPGQNWTRGPASLTFPHRLKRKIPTLINVAWGSEFFWDGRANTLEEQALGPLHAPDEMGITKEELLGRVQGIPTYRKLFSKAFPQEGISERSLTKAIATFERQIQSGFAPFDFWLAGDESAISDNAKRGFLDFNTQAKCVKCHSGWKFTNGSFADTGLAGDDLGRGNVVTNPNLRHSFKTPSLRNIDQRAPYMHDGSMPTLEAVIDHYDRGGSEIRPTTKFFIEPLHLTRQEKKDLISFLKTLTSQDEVAQKPTLPPGE